MKRLVYYVRPYYVHILIATVASIGCSVAGIWVIDLLKQVIDVTVSGKIREELLGLIVSAGVLILIGMASNYLTVTMTGFFGAGILKNLREDAVKHIMEASPDFMEKNNFGDIMARLSSDISVIAGYMQTYFKDCLYVPVMVVVFAIYLMQLHILLAVLCLLPLIVLVPLSIRLMGPVKFAQAEYVKKLGMTNNHIQEAFDGVEVIKSYNLQHAMEQKYHDALKETFDISNENDLRQYNIQPFTMMIREVPVAIALCVSGWMVFRGWMTLGMMVAALSAVKKLIDPLDSAYQLVVRTQMAMISANRVFYVMDIPKEVTEGKLKVVSQNGENVFTFQNVSFSYGGKENTTLKDLSFSIKKNHKTAIVGKSGSGKSTLIKLLSRQYGTDMGKILYFGEDILDVSPKLLRDDMALISQDAHLFPMSVLDNIRMGNPDATRKEVILAAGQAGCHEFIERMPQGYDTILEEKGNNLSGGQKQRICMARAFLKNADIFLLDEPTSALDKENEESICRTLAKIAENKTVITVAHRLTTIMDYDDIIVMEEGKIVERGTHLKLMEQKGRYYANFQECVSAGGGSTWAN